MRNFRLDFKFSIFSFFILVNLLFPIPALALSNYDIGGKFFDPWRWVFYVTFKPRLRDVERWMRFCCQRRIPILGLSPTRTWAIDRPLTFHANGQDRFKMRRLILTCDDRKLYVPESSLLQPLLQITLRKPQPTIAVELTRLLEAVLM